MSKPQFIATPEGGEMVVLSRADYDALIEALREQEEDAADVAAYDAAKADLVGSVVLPPEVSALMLKGNSLLRAWRKHRGLTQVELASRAKIGQGYLSELESGAAKNPSRATVLELAAVLEIDPDWI